MPKIISSKNEAIEYRKRSVKGVSIFVSEEALNNMIYHAEDGDNKEVMGLMMGITYCDEEGNYSIVSGTATSGLDSDDVSVRFNRESLEELFESLDNFKNEVIVGWYHSHPGFGCYLSDTDINTHKGIFGEEPGYAIVIDPSDSTIMVFTVKNGASVEERMIIMESQ